MSSEIAEKTAAGTCPFCLWQINGQDQTVTCSDCGVVLHTDCFQASGRCTTFMCPSWKALEQAVAPRAEVAVAYMQQFCTRCGTRFLPTDRFCRLDGNPRS